MAPRPGMDVRRHLPPGAGPVARLQLLVCSYRNWKFRQGNLLYNLKAGEGFYKFLFIQAYFPYFFLFSRIFPYFPIFSQSSTGNSREYSPTENSREFWNYIKLKIYFTFFDYPTRGQAASTLRKGVAEQ